MAEQTPIVDKKTLYKALCRSYLLAGVPTARPKRVKSVTPKGYNSKIPQMSKNCIEAHRAAEGSKAAHERYPDW